MECESWVGCYVIKVGLQIDRPGYEGFNLAVDISHTSNQHVMFFFRNQGVMKSHVTVQRRTSASWHFRRLTLPSRPTPHSNCSNGPYKPCNCNKAHRLVRETEERGHKAVPIIFMYSIITLWPCHDCFNPTVAHSFSSTSSSSANLAMPGEFHAFYSIWTISLLPCTHFKQSLIWHWSPIRRICTFNQ